MQKHTLANKCLSASLAVVLFIMPVVLTGCGNVNEVVQKAVTGFQIAQSGVATAKSLLPELRTLNPDLASEVEEYAQLASGNLANLITLGNAYLAAPSGDKYQNILNAVDALTATLDVKVLAMAKVSNPQSQAKALAVVTVISVGLHTVVALLQTKASKAQLKAMPVIAGRVTLEQLRPLIGPEVRSEITARGYDPDQVLSLAGF